MSRSRGTASRRRRPARPGPLAASLVLAAALAGCAGQGVPACRLGSGRSAAWDGYRQTYPEPQRNGPVASGVGGVMDMVLAGALYATGLCE